MLALFCAVLALVPARPDTFSVKLMAQSSGWTGRERPAWPPGSPWTYSSGDDSVMLWNYYSRLGVVNRFSWVGFDLSLLPPRESLVSAALQFRVYDTVGSLPLCQLTMMDHCHTDPESLFGLIEGGVVGSPYLSTNMGWSEVPLDTDGLAYLQAAPDSVPMYVGLQCLAPWPSYSSFAWSHGTAASESLRPRLEVTYARVGTAESPGAGPKPGLRAWPNPCRGRLELALGRADAGAAWEARNATGRVVCRGAVAPGTTRAVVDLSAEPVGVYTVELLTRSTRYRTRVVRL